MARIEARLLKGFRDYLPDVMIARRHMLATVSSIFERFGFSPLDTPALEYSEILLGKYGEDAEKLLYRFSDNGGRDVCMRYDLTVPLARLVAMNRNLPRPFKRYQVGPVWRAESPGRGRFREFAQCDVDIVGTSSLMADAECLAVDFEVMKALGAEAMIHVNNRKIFRGLQEVLGVEETNTMNAVIRIIDKILKIGEVGVERELRAETPLSETQVERVLAFCRIGGETQAVLTELAGLFKASEIGSEGVAELREVMALSAAMGVPTAALKLDPSIARGADYYTGTVFETFLSELPDIGSVMSGGRYDDLIGVYAGEQIPAVGISVGLDRLLAGLLEIGKISQRASVSDVLVTVFSPEVRDYALKIATQLRAARVDCEVFLDENTKLKKQMKYASNLGMPLVIIAGPDEAEAGTVSMRDMNSGAQLVVELKNLNKEVIARVGTHGHKSYDPRSWGWAWDMDTLAKVPNVRGVYILRDESKDAIRVGHVEESNLRAALEGIFEAELERGALTFDWYEIGNSAFGRDLADFLNSRLVEGE